jgi:hypothetical protein
MAGVLRLRFWPEIKELATDKRYYNRERLNYLDAAAAAAEEMIPRLRIKTAIELGPYQVPLIEGSDLADLHCRHLGEHLTWKMDARHFPWRIPDNAYDLFIALQVFEHLQPHQREAFQEVRRIARHAIISLPSNWAEGDEQHRGITPEMALEWFAPIKPSRVVMGNGGPRARYIYVFEGLS